jgi:hypothetical protein
VKAPLPKLNTLLASASTWTQDDVLTISTGVVSRELTWTGKGLVTTGLHDLRIHKNWATSLCDNQSADWSFPGLTEGNATLLSLSAAPSTDEGFTSEHLEVVAEIEYPDTGITLKLVIWAYPDAPGLRTQLWLKGRAADLDYVCRTENSADTSERRVDYLPISEGQLTGFGYFNNTQNRHSEAHHLSKEERLTEEDVNWASVLFVEGNTGGLAWVKESHKCVNRSGVDTGNFVRDAVGLHNFGSALSAEFIRSDYRWCWAASVVLYPESTSDARELAMKQFDRARFPIDATRDVWIKANTWGSGDSNLESVAKASELEVLKELDSMSDLGIDLLQVDDGWQKGRSMEADAKTHEWYPREDWYPNGWSTLRKAAAEKGIQLGLWTAYTAKLEDLKRNFDEAGFVTWKYDFTHIDNYENLFHHWSKFRDFILYTDHKAHMALDVTENAPRFGYFWARDFGCIWLANRKPNYPVKTIPKPSLLLRENRELAQYVNLNKFELPIQNFDRVNAQESDASLYGASYGVALGLMGIPTFFQTTYYYENASRDAVRDLLSIYKKEQAALYQSYVFAVGDEPNGAAWSGFQWTHPASKIGYLLIFRERQNTEASRTLSLRFSQPSDSLKVTDLRTGQTSQIELDKECQIPLKVQNPADFTFLKYTATKK